MRPTNRTSVKRSKDENNSTSTSAPSWRPLLDEALRTPGLLHEAYERFPGYSLHNQLLALCQCFVRGIRPGPLGTFLHWKQLGRSVRRGERALILCVPMARRVLPPDDATEEERVRLRFSYQPRWFTLAQTDGPDIELPVTPAWSAYTAMAQLGVRLTPFAHPSGNVEGYALPDQRISINPVAALPHKTLLHELAHIVLQHHHDMNDRAVQEVEAELVTLLLLDTLGLPGSEYSRGYIQHWANDTSITEAIAQRVMSAANTILDAGRPPRKLDQADRLSTAGIYA